MSDITTASVLRISDVKTMDLIELYSREECLWNTGDENYKEQAHRRRAAERIAAALNAPNFGPRHVIMKFKNLRNAYSQELKKIARNEAAGVDYKPSVFWFNKMDSFIRPHLQKPRGAASSSLVCHVEGTEDWLQLATPSYMLNAEVEDTSKNSCEVQLKRKAQETPHTWTKVQRLDSDSDNPKFLEISIPQSSETETNGLVSGTVLEIDQIVKTYIDDQLQSVLQTIKDMSTGLQALSSREDDVCETFGRYVAGLLRTLPRGKALEVQPQIISLITAAGLANIANNEKGQDGASVVVKEEKF